METTVIFNKLIDAWEKGCRHIWLEGGTAASKTYSILQLLIAIASEKQDPLLISCVSETIPHLKRGCIRDFLNILGDSYNPSAFNKTDLIYNFGKVKIEFFSADDPAKQRGARRDVLFLNEANNISYDAFRELDSRTRLRTICDWNPTAEFWFHQNQLGNDPGSYYIHATYQDALNVIPPTVITNILAMGAKDANWENVYIKGLLGKVEGLVYPYFEQIDAMPAGDGFYGLDFGYSNDPTSLVHCLIAGENLYSHELIYEAGLTNDMIAHRMDELGVKRNYAEIFADSSEPKSIEEIHRYGFNIKGCKKGPDSVEYGHQKVRQYKQFWTKDSLNCIKEMRNFRYIKDKDGKFTDKTTHVFSHGIDARRYGLIGMLSPEPREVLAVYDSMQLIPGGMDIR